MFSVIKFWLDRFNYMIKKFKGKITNDITETPKFICINVFLYTKHVLDSLNINDSTAFRT